MLPIYYSILCVYLSISISISISIYLSIYVRTYTVLSSQTHTLTGPCPVLQDWKKIAGWDLHRNAVEVKAIIVQMVVHCFDSTGYTLQGMKEWVQGICYGASSYTDTPSAKESANGKGTVLILAAEGAQGTVSTTWITSYNQSKLFICFKECLYHKHKYIWCVVYHLLIHLLKAFQTFKDMTSVTVKL